MSFRCGTKPYLAPEVLLKPYRAQPADLWSCGIVFVAMLTGELPWSQPSDRVEEFLKWKKDVYISETPWSKLGNTALSLARQILNVEPKSRLKLEQIEKHPWMKFDFSPGRRKLWFSRFSGAFGGFGAVWGRFVLLWRFSIVMDLIFIKLDYQSSTVETLCEFLSFGKVELGSEHFFCMFLVLFN